jgi:selenium-binding protein 1
MKRTVITTLIVLLTIIALPFTTALAQNTPHEKFLYVGTVDKGGKDPDFLTVVGVDPSDRSTYGKIVHRTDMLQIGDELHHFGYNHDHSKLMVPGLFSGRIYILDVSDHMRPAVESVREDLTKRSGYTVPHTVIGLENGNNLVSMIGANSDTTAPGGLVEINAETGKFVRTFGPRSNRDWNKEGPKYMYDMGVKVELNRMITTSFGLPKNTKGKTRQRHGGVGGSLAARSEIHGWVYERARHQRDMGMGRS